MKKGLLSLFAIAALPVMAQVEVGQVATAHLEGVTADKNNTAEVAAGTELCSSSSVKATVYVKDKYIKCSAAGSNQTLVRFGGNDSYIVKVDDKEQAVQGQSNGNQPNEFPEGQAKPVSTMANPCRLQFDASGCQYAFKAQKKGWLYIVNKISSNKNYYVVELPNNSAGEAQDISLGNTVAYRMAAHMPGFSAKIGTDDKTDKAVYGNDVFNFGVPGDANIAFYYTGLRALPWPEQILQEGTYAETVETYYAASAISKGGNTIAAGLRALQNNKVVKVAADGTETEVEIKRGEAIPGDDGCTYKTTAGSSFTPIDETKTVTGEGWDISKAANSVGASGTGVIYFQTRPGFTYVVMARGSKMTLAGYAFSEKNCLVEVKTETLAADAAEGTEPTVEFVKIVDGDKMTPIKNIAAFESDADAPMFNLQGQRVGASYKGIVIKGGKKFIQK